MARFHTFNKRVMVYDEPRNFIGDTHWRETATIQEGDELQLDKGVLIQIGEPTGKTDQDISGLFEKRRTKEGTESESSPARAAVTHHVPKDSVTSDAVPSQLRPRTLNSLLGTPKGRIGRAALLTKSPFEVRRENDKDIETMEPAAKKRRITATDEHHPNPPLDSLRRASLPQPAPVRPQETRSPRPVENRPASRISHNNPQPKRPENAVEGTTQERDACRPSKSKTNSSGKELQTDCAPQKLQEPARRPLQPQKPPESASKGSSEAIVIDSGDEPEASKGPAPPVARLMITSSKPRQKLIYKDLLPSAPVSTRHSRNAKTESEDSRSRRSQTSRAKDPASEDEPLSQFHQEQRERLRKRLKKSDQKQGGSAHHPEPAAVDNTEPLSSEEEFGTTLPDYTAASPVTSKDISNNKHPRTQTLPPPLTQPHHSTHIPISDANAELARLDAQLLQRHAPKPSKSPTNNRPTPPEPLQPSTKEPPQPPLAIPENPPHPPIPPAPKPKPNPFQRSFSAVTTSTSDLSTTKRPLRKAFSDTGPRSTLGQEAAPDAWSAEAWELFGCRREDFVK